MTRSAAKTLKQYHKAVAAQQAVYSKIPAGDLRGIPATDARRLDVLPPDHQAQAYGDARHGHLSPDHYDQLVAQSEQQQRAKAERNGRVGRMAQRLLATAALAGTIFGGVKAVQAIEHGVASHNAAATAQFNSDQRRIGPGIKQMMVEENKAVLADYAKHPTNYLPGSADGTKRPGVFEITRMDTTSLYDGEHVFMGMTNGKPDVEKPMYIDIPSYVDGGDMKTAGEVQLVAPAGDNIANTVGGTYNNFSHTVEGYAAREVGAVSDSTDSSFDGGFTYDTTDPGLSAGYGQRNPSVASVAGTIHDHWPNDHGV